MDRPFEPKLLTVLREGYSFKLFGRDLVGGVIVGIVALPLSIAFAIASGVKPEQGLITAVIGGFLISLLGGSRVQIGGPTGAFIVIVYGIIQEHGYDGLAVATLMAGVMLVAFGLARLGHVIKFIPYPVTVGFTAGIALIIFTAEIQDFLGLQLSHTPEFFVEKWAAYAAGLGGVNVYAFFIGLLTVLVLIFWRKVTDRVPGPLVAIVLATVLVQWLGLPVETIGSRFGSVPNTIPAPRMPVINMEMISRMFQPAVTIALLAGIESLLSAVVADGMTGRRHRSNMELIAQGAANIVSPFFQGIPATGAIARTATNVKNGGQTPVAGIIHACTVFVLFLFFGKWAALIPMASLAGILMVVAYNMSEWHLFVGLFRGPKSDVLVLLTTFFLTVLVDLTVALEVGMVLAAFLFMRRMAEVTEVSYLNESLSSEDPLPGIGEAGIPEGVQIFEINGPFFFGAADKFESTIRGLTTQRPKILILRMRFVPSIDATGLQALKTLTQKAKKDGIRVILSGVRPRPFKLMNESGLIKQLGREHVCFDIKEALTLARSLL